MVLNPYFTQGTSSEQNLVQDLVNEQLRTYGVEIFYLPRKFATEKSVIREVVQSKFDLALPLEAYDEIETDDTAFLLLGGSESYQKQAKDLGLKNFKHLPTTGELEPIHKFLNTLNVYAHGRSDGEQCSCAIIEAMSHGLPVISHTAPSMGQLEQIADAGEVVDGYEEYAEVMKKMMYNKNYYVNCKINSNKRYENVYKLDTVIKKYVEIYKEVATKK